MTTGYGHRLRLRLFLEGVEVPVISANVRSAPNSPTVASLQIPPLPEGTRFFPRTVVHLFFLDLYEQDNPLIQQKSNSSDRRSPTTHEDTITEDESDEFGLRDAENRRYKLLFGGEMVGFQWTKSSSSRSLVLQCIDWSNYWDYAYQWNNTGIFGPGIKAIFSGGASNLFTDFLSSKGSVITRIVSSGRCNSFPKLRGLAAGIVRLIEAVGGTYFPKPGTGVKKLAGQNLFFSVAELRLHITHMLAALEEDATSAKLLNRRGFYELFGRRMGGLGGQASIRKCINALTGVIFHETYGQPAPYFQPGTAATQQRLRSRGRLVDNPRLSPIVTDVQTALSTTQAVRAEQGTALVTGNTPLLEREPERDSQIQRLQSAIRALSQAFIFCDEHGGPSEIRSLISQARSLLSEAAKERNRISIEASANDFKKFERLVDNAVQKMNNILDGRASVIKVTPGEPPRLNQHILRPDVWFTAPPRCNVLFPDDYESLSYQRMYLQEPTRFMLKTNDEFFGENFLFDKFYFAPQAGSVKRDKSRLRDMMRGDVLDHELFTGILPVFEKMGEFNVFAAKSGTKKGQLKVGFAQRSANFLYFKHRYAARQMQVACKFNPYIAVGFPGLVIDKYADDATIRTYNELVERDNERRVANNENELTPSRVLGTNFLANFTEVSHYVSQAEGTSRTEINCSYARQPDETVEFLGGGKTSLFRQHDKSAIRATDVAAISAPKLGSQGPAKGKIINVTDVTDQYLRGNGGRKLPVFGGPRLDRGGQHVKTLVEIGVPTTAGQLSSTDVEEIIGARDRLAVFRAFRIDEEIPRFTKETEDLPTEELIRPGWYGDVWTNSKIGRAYNTFFGTGSITDTQVATDGIVGLSAVNERLTEAQTEADRAESADDPIRDLPIVAALDEGSTISQAVDFLLLSYSFVRLSGGNVNQFTRGYTWRPVASMVDMFGTSDLRFDDKGEKLVAGVEGFHSRAFGDYDNLFGLAGPDLQNILGIKRGTTTAARADTRKRKLLAVRQYVSALLFSRGNLG